MSLSDKLEMLKHERARLIEATQEFFPKLGIRAFNADTSGEEREDEVERVRREVNTALMANFEYRYDDDMAPRPFYDIEGGGWEIWVNPIHMFLEAVANDAKESGDCEDTGLLASFLCEAAGVPINRLYTVNVVSETQLIMWRQGRLAGREPMMDHSLSGVMVRGKCMPLGDTWFYERRNWNLPIDENEGGWHMIFMYMPRDGDVTDWFYGDYFAKTRPLDPINKKVVAGQFAEADRLWKMIALNPRAKPMNELKAMELKAKMGR